MLSLPTVKQLEAGDFDLDELSKKLGDVLADESQRNEIVQLTGNIAVLTIECLDKVSEITPHPSASSPYHSVDHVFRELQDQPGRSNAL